MSKNKKFYWLKLQNNFFDRDEMKIVEALPNGKDYIIFYLKLLLRSVETEGKLRFRDIIPYTPEMLSSITNTNIDTVRAAIKLFTELKLMELWDDGTLFMVETQNMIGSETEWAKKKREYRKQIKESEKVKQIEDNVLDKKDEVRQEIDTEIDIEIELDIDKEIDSNYVGFFNNNFHLISPYEKEILESFEKDGLESKLITLALQKALDKNKRSVDYVKGILNNWLKDNIKTVEQARIKEKEYQRSKGGGKNGDSEQCIKELENEGLGFTV